MSHRSSRSRGGSRSAANPPQTVDTETTRAVSGICASEHHWQCGIKRLTALFVVQDDDSNVEHLLATRGSSSSGASTARSRAAIMPDGFENAQ